MKKKNTLLVLAICSILLLSNKFTKAQCNIDDWTALKALHEAIGIDNWHNNYGWEILKNDEPPLDCDLEKLIGVELDGNGRVMSLFLYFTGTSGVIPPELGKLSMIKSLVFSSCGLHGSIPPELGNLINLTRLSLDGNRLSGSIPPELENLSKLTILNLSYNELIGSIPIELRNLIKLEFLILRNNELSGNIPPGLGKLNNLIELDLRNNSLNGNIPLELEGLTNLKQLFLDGNKLTGNIPAEIGELSNLNGLNLSNNLLKGNIPSTLSNLTSLSSLRLNNNQLTGNIPNELSNLSLTVFDVSENQLEGNIPDINIVEEYYVIFYLYEFNFRSNYFTCNDFENISDDMPRGGLYAVTPQKYKHNGKQSFLIDDPNESISLSAPNSNTDNFTYQWYRNETPIEGATDTVLHLSSVQFEDVGFYTLQATDTSCTRKIYEYYGDLTQFIYISDPISVRRTDLEGCTDINSCNYNQFAMIDDSSCEYIWCDTMTNPIKIRTTNETILSDTQIKFDLVIDSLGLDYSADGLTMNLDTRGNYNLESVEVISPVLSIVEVDVSKLNNNILSIDRINSQRLGSNEPILSITACIPSDDIPTDEETCSHFAISGGTELSSGHFISFDDIYIDVPFSDCSPYRGYGVEGGNWLPLVLIVSPQNCNLSNEGLIEIKILEEGQSPYTYVLKNDIGETVNEGNSIDKMIEIDVNAGNYELTVIDANDKQTQRYICVPLIGTVDSSKACNTDCVDYLIIPGGEIIGTHFAKKEIEIRGFISGNETVEINICD